MIRHLRGRFDALAFVALTLLDFGAASSQLVAQSATQAKAAPARLFEVQVVGSNGKPVPELTVEVRLDPPLLVDSQIKRGELVQMGGYETSIKTDADGRVALELRSEPKLLRIKVEQPGYGPYWAEWNSSEHPQTVPANFVAELDEGWTVGGVVVDGEGNPVEGATVNPNIKFKKRPGDHDELHVGTEVTTEADGKWRFASVPASMRDVHVSIDHVDYMPERRTITRSEFGVEAGKEPAAKIPLKRGVIVVGTVTDEKGNPVDRAVIRSQFFNENRQTTTGSDGTYFLAGCEPRMTRIIAFAPGRAMELQEVRVEPGMEPVDFVLKPGGKIRVRVVDEKGNPIPRTRIFFQKWRGSIDYFEFDHVNDYADHNGIWEWNEAPLDEIKADICRPGGMQLLEQSLVAREEEYVFSPPPLLVIRGKVVDAETKESIEKFRVVPGMQWDNGQDFWSDREGYEAEGGKYRIERDRGHIAHRVRVEAPAYRRSVSREIKSDEGNVTIDFELEKGGSIAATIVTPEGAPAARAKVALGIADAQIMIENGEIDDGSTYAARHDADEAGRTNFSEPDEPFQLMVTHPSGFARVKSADGTIPETIELTPWARVEGTFKVGTEPGANVVLDLNSNGIGSYGQGEPRIHTSDRTTTGSDGEFVFERVVPGDGWIGRRILVMMNEGATEVTSSKRVPVTFVAGETTRVELGGDGRAVVGRLAPPTRHEGKVLWNFAMIDARVGIRESSPPPIPDDAKANPERQRAWWNEWKETEEGKAWQKTVKENQRLSKSLPNFSASVASDGRFRLDDVPPGDGTLNVRFHEHVAGQLLNYRFSVPAAEGGDLSDVVDLGVITLEPAAQR